ncbi:MAG: tetratricopeptide repeat-containing sensor histidine kinase [Chloroherpetonaceae bacterium]|nr:tetratricopeptide repeat-containing sensor histidine kinase [Chloroherpetonaceae bacterium]
MNRESLDTQNNDRALLSSADAMRYHHAAGAMEIYSALEKSHCTSNIELCILAKIGKAFSAILLGDFSLAFLALSESEAAIETLEINRSSPNLERVLRGKILKTKGFFYEHQGEPEKAIDAHERALPLLEEAGEVKDEAASTLGLANAYGRIGNYKHALINYLKAESLNRELIDEEGAALAIMGRGIIFSRIGETAEAIESLYQALAIFEQMKSQLNTGKTLINIGTVLLEREQFEKAKDVFAKAMGIYRSLGNETREISAASNLALAYLKLKDYNAFRFVAEEALEKSRKSSNLDARVSLLHNLGEAAFEQSNFTEAESYLRDALSLACEIKERKKEAQVRLALAALLAKTNRESEAEEAYLEAHHIGLDLGELRLQSTATAALSAFYESTQKPLFALDYLKQHLVLERELQSKERKRSIESLEIKFESERIRREAEAERERSTALTAALKSAEEANRVKTEVLNIVAHDLQTPISSVLNFSYLLKSAPALNEKQREMLGYIESVSKAMLRQTVNLLNAASEKSSSEMMRERVNLKVLIEECLVTSGAERKSQQIKRSLATVGDVEGDPDKLREVLENIIGNAVKYSPRCSTIQISLSEKLDVNPNGIKPASLLFSVHDEGQGMTEEDLSKLFGKFQRLSAKPTGGETSTGLGLYITKQIIEHHGGKIWATSEGLGKGSTFWVELPLGKF